MTTRYERDIGRIIRTVCIMHMTLEDMLADLPAIANECRGMENVLLADSPTPNPNATVHRDAIAWAMEGEAIYQRMLEAAE